MKPTPSPFRRRLEAMVQAQKNIRREAARRLIAMGGTMPGLEYVRRRRIDEQRTSAREPAEEGETL